MKIKITNAKEAGMPSEMIKNCEQLLEWRIADKHKIIKVGDPVDILYSETDPLMDKENWGEDAYAIYFTVSGLSPEKENDVEKLNIELELSY